MASNLLLLTKGLISLFNPTHVSILLCNYSKIKEKCGILIVDIDVDNANIIDFSEPQGYAVFQCLLNIIKENYSSEKYESILNRGYAYIIKVLEELEKKQKVKYISRFDVICAVYPKELNKKKKNIPSNFITCVQKQICIKNPKVINNIQEMNHSEITRATFNLIKNNRGEINDK